MASDRREFLKLAAGTAVAAGLPLPGARSLDAATQKTSTPRGGTPGSMTPEERRRLVGKAVFGPKVTQTVVEPHMTGITGVLSLLYFEAATGKTYYVNGGMNAPMAKLTGWGAGATATGLGAAVPGFWAGYEASREQFGSKSSKDLCIWIDPDTGQRRARGDTRRCAMAKAV